MYVQSSIRATLLDVLLAFVCVFHSVFSDGKIKQNMMQSMSHTASIFDQFTAVNHKHVMSVLTHHSKQPGIEPMCVSL